MFWKVHKASDKETNKDNFREYCQHGDRQKAMTACTTQQSLSSVMLCVTNINFLLCQMFVEAVDTAAHGRLKMFEHLCVCVLRFMVAFVHWDSEIKIEQHGWKLGLLSLPQPEEGGCGVQRTQSPLRLSNKIWMERFLKREKSQWGRDKMTNILMFCAATKKKGLTWFTKWV